MNFKYIKIPNNISYQDALNLQLDIFDKVHKGQYEGVLLILEHNPVLTLGIRTDINNLLVSEVELINKGVEIYRSDRGGDITYHGPGQIVAYPIFNLKYLNKSIKWYVEKLEEVVIKTIAHYKLNGHIKPEFPGVWVDDKKICAVGIKVKKWITYHGFAFNVETDKKYFDLIIPCGISDFGVSSLNDYVDCDIDKVKDEVIKEFENVFSIKLEKMTLDDI